MNISIILLAASTGSDYEKTASILNNVSIVLFVLAVVFLILGIVTFIVFKIPTVIGDLTGRNARKSIEQIRERNEKGGKKSHRPHPVAVDRGTLTDQIKESEHLPKKPITKQNKKPKPTVPVGSKATDVLKDVNATAKLDYDENGTEVLNEGTQVLSEEAINTAINEPAVEFKMIQSIVLIHTEEVI